MKDLSHLPTEAPKDDGTPPDLDDTFVRVLVDELAAAPPKPQVADTLTRHSAAGSCLKKVALIADGVTPEPMDLAGFHVTNIGTLIHEAWQAALERQHGDAIRFEVLSTIEDLTSGSCDAVITEGDHQHVLELKTEGEFGFDMISGLKSDPPAPKPTHLMQLALNVVGLGADKGTLVYLRRSSHSAGSARRFKLGEVSRFGVQFTFSRDDLDPVADEWLTMLRFIRDNSVDAVGRHVPRVMPKGARLNPESGVWTLQDGDAVLDSGEYWAKGAGCKDYCGVRDECVARWTDGR